MVELTLVKRFTLLALNGEVCNHYSMSKKHKMRCVLASVFFDLYLKGIIKKEDGNYVLSNRIDGMNSYEEYVYELFEKEPKKSLTSWLNTIGKVSYKLLSNLESFIVFELTNENLIDEVSDLIECDMFYATAGVKINLYRAIGEQYQFEIEALRAEILEEGNISDEAVILMWLMEQCQKLNDIFSKEEEVRLLEVRNHLYEKNSLAREILPLQLRAVLLNGWIHFLKVKKRIFYSKVGTGVAFIFPGLQRDHSIFIDSDQWLASKGDRLTQTVALLESKGHICKIKSYGQVSLVEIDNVLYELIPDAVVAHKIPIYGVRLRRYQI